MMKPKTKGLDVRLTEKDLQPTPVGRLTEKVRNPTPVGVLTEKVSCLTPVSAMCMVRKVL